MPQAQAGDTTESGAKAGRLVGPSDRPGAAPGATHPRPQRGAGPANPRLQPQLYYFFPPQKSRNLNLTTKHKSENTLTSHADAVGPGPGLRAVGERPVPPAQGARAPLASRRRTQTLASEDAETRLPANKGRFPRPDLKMLIRFRDIKHDNLMVFGGN